MEQAEILSTLQAHAAKYAQHRQYIDKARQAGSKFPPAVVEKVCLDHEVKSAQVADEVAPLLPKLSELIAVLEKEKQEISSSKTSVDEQIQEMELRAAIGELSESDFESQSADLRNNASSANDRIAAIDADLVQLTAGRDHWIGLAEPHGHYHAAPARRSFGGAAARAAADTNGDEVHHAARVDIREDVSTVFGNDGPAQVRVPDAQDEIAIETSEVGEDDGDVVSADVQFAGGDIAIEANDAVEANDAGSEGGGAGGRAGGASGGRAGEVVAAAEISVAAEIEVGGLDGGVSGGEVEVEIGGDGKSAEGDAGARRALLIYQESTAEEQIYPFTNDQLTIGRGRENDIQIKNDSKVSRYHCKLFRRGNNFYVEDIKSSNGTLVNGELITDRRLFGGEEIVIGETYFRFRIME